MTPFKEVYELARATIQDYKLDNLKRLDTEAYETVMETFLLLGKTKFTKCLQSLDIDKENRSFVSDLTDQEKVILSDYTAIQWFSREIKNVTAFNGGIKNREFDHYSEAQNLKEKTAYFCVLQEKVNQDVQDYLLSNSSSWESAFKL